MVSAISLAQAPFHLPSVLLPSFPPSSHTLAFRTRSKHEPSERGWPPISGSLSVFSTVFVVCSTSLNYRGRGGGEGGGMRRVRSSSERVLSGSSIQKAYLLFEGAVHITAHLWVGVGRSKETSKSVATNTILHRKQ